MGKFIRSYIYSGSAFGCALIWGVVNCWSDRVGQHGGAVVRLVPAFLVFAALAIVAGCSPDSGEVNVHGHNVNADSGSWVGMVITEGQSQDHEIFFLAEGEVPGVLSSGDGSGMYVEGGTPTQHEIQAAIEHEATEGLRLHSECYVFDALDFAVAVTDKELAPAVAWRVGDGCGTFESIQPTRAECEASITEWRYEDRFDRS